MHDVIGAVINIMINMEHNGTLLNNGQLGVCVQLHGWWYFYDKISPINFLLTRCCANILVRIIINCSCINVNMCINVFVGDIIVCVWGVCV